ncbi:Aste57867_17879 [Aphanomyces stellatus]|uniref:Aste57867_17879 protein n=1 Tax=Aphanomyces stellatus TaxID=120398 RepID=A0A485LAE8_9STRA|nr:hypothetical protein As57867_017818 [Aphanomyces stellatus]VFT94622.1 Aste57867_17879 [Aphanomyces stellatus]
MFSGGRNNHAAAAAKDASTTKKRDWLNIGKTYVDTLMSDDSDDEAVARETAASSQSREVVHVPKEKKAKAPPRKPLPPPRESAVFEIDHGGDRDNLFYGTLADKDKPRYHLVKRHKHHDNETSVRYFDPKQQPMRRLFMTTDQASAPPPLDLTANFVSVDPYNEIADTDESLQTEHQRLEAHIMAQNKKFNEDLRASPHNVSLWIRYMAAQEREGAFVKNKLKQRAVILEKQHAILDKARASNPDALELQKIAWLMALHLPEESQLMAELEKHIHAAPDNELLWLLVVQRTQEQFGAFSLPRMRNLYARILQTLQSMTTGDESTGASLVLFATLLSTLEVKSGYTERGLGLMQALIEYNCGMPSSLTSTSTRLHAFEAFWNQDFPRYGEAGHVAWSAWYDNHQHAVAPPPPLAYADDLVPDMAAFVAELQQRAANQLREMQPPLHLKGDLDHPYHTSDGSDDADDDASSHAARATAGDEYVWSNLHGYRIPIQDAHDAIEYERILQELKSNRPAAPAKKQKHNQLADRDERLGYDAVSKTDPHVSMLVEEELLQATQWRPLHARNPDDAAMIEAQPDRVLLFEEIQPFLFAVSPPWHAELTRAYLSLLGVSYLPRRRASAVLQWMYEDDVVSPTNPMVRVCVEMLHRRTRTPCDPLALLHATLHERVAVTQDALHDPSRVTHIRHMLWQTQQLTLLMEFETIVATALAKPDAPRALAKQLLAAAPTDMALWEQYAYMEWRLGNPKQVSRICEKTIESLATLDLHRFLYLRLRMELFDDDGGGRATKEQQWRSLYLVYRAFNHEADSLAKMCKKLDKKKLEYDTIVPASSVRQLRLRLQQQVDHASTAIATAQPHAAQLPALPFCVYNHAVVLLAVDGQAAAAKYFKKWIDTAKSNASTRTAAPRALMPNVWASVAEWLTAAYLDFIKRTGCAPRQWRHVTHLAMTLMPDHPTFVHVFVDAEQKNTMNQQVRRAVQSALQTSRLHFDAASPMVHLMALVGEIHRLEKTNKLETEDMCCGLHQWGPVAITRIRRAFEDAVDSISWRSQGSALLWRLYLRFEVQAGQVQHAIKVFYRGIYKCPWSKELYLDSLRLLRPYLTDDNVQEVLGFLVGKELYLRNDNV